MSRFNHFLYLFIVGFVLVQSRIAEGTGRPNIIVFMTDDAGYSDISLYGSEIKTPHIDQLADQGMVFRKFYNNARCSPTRASLLTGLYAHSVGVGELCGKGYVTDLPGYAGLLQNHNNVTVAELLKDAGYETLLSGKWHLGGEPDFPESSSSHPLRRGFTKFYGMLGPSADYFDAKHYWDGYERATPPDDDPNWFSEDAFGDKAVEWIDAAVAEEKPFFLHFAFKAPHNPRQALDEDYQSYLPVYAKEHWPEIMASRRQGLVAQGILPAAWEANGFEFDAAYYDAMPQGRAENLQDIAAIKAGAIVSADRNVGKVMASLERLGQLENTLVFFFSDNGSALAHDLNNIWNAPFRGSKGDLTEGGIASHCIVQWPDVIAAQRTVPDLAGILDVMPTVLEVAGVTYPEQYQGKTLCPLAGSSLVPLFRGEEHAFLNQRTLFWELYGQRAVIQDNKWKYYKSYDPKSGQSEEFLFDIEQDGTEMHNLIDTSTGRAMAASLRANWNAWAARVGAKEYAEVREARQRYIEKGRAPAASSQIVNGSFEDEPAGTLVPPSPSEDRVSGWRAFDTSGANSIRLIRDASVASDGRCCIEIESTLHGAGLGDTGIDVTFAGEGAVMLVPGKTYTVTFDAQWVSGPDNSLHIAIRAKKGAGQPETTFFGEIFELTPQWKTYSYTFSVTDAHRGSNGEAPRFYLGFRPKAGSALQREIIRIDHVRLEKR